MSVTFLCDEASWVLKGVSHFRNASRLPQRVSVESRERLHSHEEPRYTGRKSPSTRKARGGQVHCIVTPFPLCSQRFERSVLIASVQEAMKLATFFGRRSSRDSSRESLVCAHQLRNRSTSVKSDSTSDRLRPGRSLSLATIFPLSAIVVDASSWPHGFCRSEAFR
jgi:hypothetical protein